MILFKLNYHDTIDCILNGWVSSFDWRVICEGSISHSSNVLSRLSQGYFIGPFVIYINDILQYNCIKYILEYTATAANSLGTIIGLAIATIIIMQMLMQLIIVQLHTAYRPVLQCLIIILL